MPEFEVVTGFYTIVPWLSGGILIFGIVATVGLAILMGWYIGKNPKTKATNFWLSLGWIPLFAIFVSAVFSANLIYTESRAILFSQIKSVSNIEVLTLVRSDTSQFIGTNNEGKLIHCQLVDKDKTNDIYTLKCSEEGKL